MTSVKKTTRNIVFGGLAILLIITSLPVASAQGAAPGPKSAAAAATNTGRVFYVAAGKLNVRTGPGTGHAVAQTHMKGHQLKVYEERGQWARVSRPGEPALWVYAPLLSRDKPSPRHR